MRQPHPLMLRLRKERQAQGLRQADAAHRAGIGRTTLSQWELGIHQPTLEWLDVYLESMGFRLDIVPIDPQLDLGVQLPYGRMVIGKGEKWCGSCARIRSSCEFNTDRSRRDGLWRKCKHCRRDDQARQQPGKAAA